MNCQEVRQHLTSILAEAGPGVEKLPVWMEAEIQIHLRACPDCQGWQAGERRFLDHLGRVPLEEPPADFRDHVMRQVRALAESQGPSSKFQVPSFKTKARGVQGNWWLRPSFIAQGMAAAACVMLFFSPFGALVSSGTGEWWNNFSAPSDSALTLPTFPVGTDAVANIAGNLHFQDTLWIVIFFAVVMVGNALLMYRKNKREH